MDAKQKIIEYLSKLKHKDEPISHSEVIYLMQMRDQVASQFVLDHASMILNRGFEVANEQNIDEVFAVQKREAERLAKVGYLLADALLKHR